MKYSKIIISFAMLLYITGCWSRHELNELNITLGLAIDKLNGRYYVSAQVVVPDALVAKKSDFHLPATTVEASGATLQEAIKRITTTTSRRIYLAHLRTVIISEELAKSGIRDILDFFSRNNQIRPDFYIVIAKDVSAQQVLSVIPRIEKVPSQRLYRTLQNSEKEWGPTTGVYLDKLILGMTNQGSEAVLTGVTVIGNDASSAGSKSNVERMEGAAAIQLRNLAVFKKDRLVGWLNEDQSKAYNYIMNNIQKTSGHLPCLNSDRLIGIDIMKSNTHVRAFVKNKRPIIHIQVNFFANVSEVQCPMNLNQETQLKQIEGEAEKKLKEIIVDTIDEVQKKYRTDIFRFGHKFHQSVPTYWISVKDHWNRVFETLQVEVSVDGKIVNTGSDRNSVINKLEQKEESAE